LPQFTVDEKNNNILFVDEGHIVGGTLGATGIHEHELRLTLESSTVATESYSFFTPCTENGCTLTFPTPTPVVGDTYEVTFVSQVPHGLEGVSQAKSCRVSVVCGPFEDVLIGDKDGLKCTIVDRTTFRASVVATTTAEVGVAILHCEALAVEDIARILQADARSQNVKFEVSYVRGHFQFGVRGDSPLSVVELAYSAEDADSSGNPRGLGFALGRPPRDFVARDASRMSFYSEGAVTSCVPVHFPPGIVDISAIGSLVAERFNVLNLSYTVGLGEHALQMGVTNAFGVTSALRLPSGKYDTSNLSGYLEQALADVAGGSWTVTYANSVPNWTITSDGDFALHFGAAAEISTGWYTSSGAPANANSAALLARMLGLTPNCSFYSSNKTLKSVEASSITNYPQYPRHSRLNQEAGVFTHSETPSARRTLAWTYVVGARDPSTRKIGCGTRKPAVVAVAVASATNVTDNLGLGITMCELSLEAAASYTSAPPLGVQVGQIVRFANKTTSVVVSGQVVDLGIDGTTCVVGINGAMFPLLFDGTAVDAVGGTTDCALWLHDEPRTALRCRDKDVFRQGSMHDRVGLREDQLDIRHFSEFVGTWKTDHDPSILLRITPVGSAEVTMPSTISVSRHGNLECLARILVRPSGIGIAHTMSSGAQEILLNRQRVEKLHVTLLNTDGTLYDTHHTDHLIALIVTHQV